MIKIRFPSEKNAFFCQNFQCHLPNGTLNLQLHLLQNIRCKCNKTPLEIFLSLKNLGYKFPSNCALFCESRMEFGYELRNSVIYSKFDTQNETRFERANLDSFSKFVRIWIGPCSLSFLLPPDSQAVRGAINIYKISFATPSLSPKMFKGGSGKRHCKSYHCSHIVFPSLIIVH